MFCWKKRTNSWYYETSVCLFHLSSCHSFSVVMISGVSKKWVQKTQKEVSWSDKWSKNEKMIGTMFWWIISQRSIVPKRATDTLIQCVSITVFLTHVCVIHVDTKLWYQKGYHSYLWYLWYIIISLISLFSDVFVWFLGGLVPFSSFPAGDANPQHSC